MAASGHLHFSMYSDQPKVTLDRHPSLPHVLMLNVEDADGNYVHFGGPEERVLALLASLAALPVPAPSTTQGGE